MNIVDRVLPPYCYNLNNRFDPRAAVIHWVSVDVGNRDLSSDLQEWQRYDIDTLFNFFVEFNRHPSMWGPIWKPVQSSNPKARGYGSYHFVIGLSSDVYRFAPQDVYAYHAGESRFQGRDNCNSWCWGIALVGPQPGGGFVDGQYDALVELLQHLGLGADEIVGHDEARRAWKAEYPETARANKVADKPDPGIGFLWDRVKWSL